MSVSSSAPIAVPDLGGNVGGNILFAQDLRRRLRGAHPIVLAESARRAPLLHWYRHVSHEDTPLTMHTKLTEIGEIEEFERLLAASGERPLLIFKYSATCGTSAQALDELLAHLNEHPADATYAIVTVQTHRDVSHAIARTLGIRHETPQALLIRDGRVVWSASHYRVTAEAVEHALQEELNNAEAVPLS